MSEPTTYCAACRAPITLRIVGEDDYLCVPCRRKAAAAPSADSEVPHDFAEHLFSMNQDPQDYRKIAWREDAAFHRGYIDKVSESCELYQKWSPKLLAFADRCRADQPIPPESSLGSTDQAKQQIYETKIKNAEPLPQVLTQYKITICCLPLVGISVAKRLWPGESDRTVILTPEEKSRWNEIYSHPKDAFWWFIHYWWSIDDSPEQKFTAGDVTFTNWFDNEVPEGCSPWLVNSGLRWGPLFGGAKTELWLWDGNNCKFVRIAGGFQF